MPPVSSTGQALRFGRLVHCQDGLAEAFVVEDAGGPETVVGVGVGIVASGDFKEVVEDAVDSADGILKLPRGVSGEDGVDGGLVGFDLHEH